jgi:hypothetical protein
MKMDPKDRLVYRWVKGTVQKMNLAESDTCQLIGLSLRKRRRDFQLILSIASPVKDPLSVSVI